LHHPSNFPDASPAPLSTRPQADAAPAAELEIGEYLPEGTSAWVLSDGKIGDEVQCLGILEAMGLEPERRLVAPRKIFAFAMPWGPIDPREARSRKKSPIAGPLPDIIIAAGRRCVPYLRYLKTASGGAAFTVFVKDPYCRRHGADLIWVPEHDRLRGDNVITTLTPANRLSAAILARARRSPDPRIAALPHPRVALMLGGPSNHHSFGAKEEDDLKSIAVALALSGAGMMVTPSRRTPKRLVSMLHAALCNDTSMGERAFVWLGEDENPYVAMLANADSIIVTGDSVNMIGESLASGAPVHVYEPCGGHRKITAYIDDLVAQGLVRRWRGRLEDWSYTPLNATPHIAAEVKRRFLAFREKKMR